MSTDIEHLTTIARDLFANALGEPFKPECDPQNRQHTLDRLATVTFLKGKDLGVESAKYFHYKPSWAADTEVYALTREISSPLESANGLHIYNHSVSDYLDVSQFVDGDGVSIVLEANHDSTRFDHLEEMGDRLVVVRRAIAQAAYRAFNYTAVKVDNAIYL